MRNVDKFLSNPPLFMQRNHIVFTGAGPLASGDGGGTHEFALINARQKTRYRSGVFLGIPLGPKADAGAYRVRATNAGHSDLQADDAERFEAIWSGYRAKQAVQCQLGPTGPAIMLTPELTGCTVAFTSNPDGTALFSHYNLMQPGDRNTRPAAGMLGRTLIDFPDPGRVGVISKEHYHRKGHHPNAENECATVATVVGWRQNGVWTFWVQYVEKHQGVAQIRRVRRLETGRIYC